MALVLEGEVCRGLGVAGDFTGLDWVQAEVYGKLGFIPYPGTLNLRLTMAAQKVMEQIKRQQGVILESSDSRFCAAVCYPVLINNQVKAVIVYPHVQDYPSDKLELIAPVRLMDALNLVEGQTIYLELTEL
jgi:CTP-dependent riboflavin kinase